LVAVLPDDLLGAKYGREVLAFFDQHFEEVQIEPQPSEVFGDLQLRVVLLWARGYRGGKGRGDSKKLGGEVSDVAVEKAPGLLSAAYGGEYGAGRSTYSDVQKALAEVSLDDRIARLGDVAKLRIGYVSGDVRFFHVSERTRNELGLSLDEVVPSVLRSRVLAGVVNRRADWTSRLRSGDACWLIQPTRLSAQLQRYLRSGRGMEIDGRAKCRTREPWWLVPVGEMPIAFVVYSGARPRIVSNRARCYASNALFSIQSPEFEGDQLALLSMCTVSRLGLLTAGRRLGGGLQKLDLFDVRNLLIPRLSVPKDALERVDELVRNGDMAAASQRADQVVLRDGLGWSAAQVRDLQRLLRRVADSLHHPPLSISPHGS
jgi:hypothetical protein